MTLGTRNFVIKAGDTVKVVCPSRGATPTGAVVSVVACLENPARFVLAGYEDTSFGEDEVEVVAYARGGIPRMVRENKL